MPPSVPSSRYSLPLWSAFYAATADHFLLDYLDHDQRVPVNRPPGFALWAHPDNAPGAYLEVNAP
ncbi:hypothetical protein OH76DRAFT_1395458 [Lentinus brumalis]|uniref:Uncharacterized protein n=1 Tax=Lentinus brumalis TaxID=2498619 RepID=A0A371DV51_9APHY|nr:hypothetical protein OH76DRAFT_1395458 [Polyporus brumalis]